MRRGRKKLDKPFGKRKYRARAYVTQARKDRMIVICNWVNDHPNGFNMRELGVHVNLSFAAAYKDVQLLCDMKILSKIRNATRGVHDSGDNTCAYKVIGDPQTILTEPKQ